MPDQNLKLETIRTHLQDAQSAIRELTRQIAERERFSIPTIGLEEELKEIMAAYNTLMARLSTAEASDDQSVYQISEVELGHE